MGGLAGVLGCMPDNPCREVRPGWRNVAVDCSGRMFIVTHKLRIRCVLDE